MFQINSREILLKRIPRKRVKNFCIFVSEKGLRTDDINANSSSTLKNVFKIGKRIYFIIQEFNKNSFRFHFAGYYLYSCGINEREGKQRLSCQHDELHRKCGMVTGREIQRYVLRNWIPDFCCSIECGAILKFESSSKVQRDLVESSESRRGLLRRVNWKLQHTRSSNPFAARRAFILKVVSTATDVPAKFLRYEYSCLPRDVYPHAD